MGEIKLFLTEPQEQFVFSTAPHPAMCAGYGAGKSQAGVVRILLSALKYPGMSFAFVEPTYDLVRRIAWPRFEEILESWGIGYTLNKQESVMVLANKSQIIFRSADNPSRLVGFEVADALIDEADVLSERDADEVWVKMLGRARQKKPDGGINTVACVSTPEGYKWLWRVFEKEQRPGYELIRAPTASNPYLPAGYLEQLKATYPANLLLAYTEGIFTNLQSGSVYGEFDRALNATSEVVRPGETLHIGMDFNVAHGAAVIHVLRGDNPHAVAEKTEVFDTPAMIGLLKRDFAGHAMIIYPDASGGSRKSNNASESDLSLLRAAGFRVCVNPANPAVKDRVLAVNMMIHKAGVRRYRVNPEKCPHLVESLEKQAYTANGEPDKSGGLDHCFSGDTLVLTPNGLVRIDQLPSDGVVMGPFGMFVEYTNAGIKIESAVTVRVVLSSGECIQCTPEHQVLTEDGKWTQAKELKAGQELFLSSRKQNSNIAVSVTTFAAFTFKTMANVFTGAFGWINTAKFHMGIMSTIRTTTGQTTKLTTWKQCLSQIIIKNMPTINRWLEKEHGILGMVKKSFCWPLNGTVPRMAYVGTRSITQKVAPVCMKKDLSAFVPNAELVSLQPTSAVCFAQKHAHQKIGASLASTTKVERAWFAGTFLKLINIPMLPVAAKLVLVKLAAMEYCSRKALTAWRAARRKSGQSVFLGRFIAHTSAKQITVKAVLPAENVPVYCLTSPLYGAFSLANGVVVANCMDAVGYLIVYRYPLTARPAMSLVMGAATN